MHLEMPAHSEVRTPRLQETTAKISAMVDGLDLANTSQKACLTSMPKWEHVLWCNYMDHKLIEPICYAREIRSAPASPRLEARSLNAKQSSQRKDIVMNGADEWSVSGRKRRKESLLSSRTERLEDRVRYMLSASMGRKQSPSLPDTSLPPMDPQDIDLLSVDSAIIYAIPTVKEQEEEDPVEEGEDRIWIDEEQPEMHACFSPPGGQCNHVACWSRIKYGVEPNNLVHACFEYPGLLCMDEDCLPSSNPQEGQRTHNRDWQRWGAVWNHRLHAQVDWDTKLRQQYRDGYVRLTWSWNAQLQQYHAWMTFGNRPPQYFGPWNMQQTWKHAALYACMAATEEHQNLQQLEQERVQRKIWWRQRREANKGFSTVVE